MLPKSLRGGKVAPDLRTKLAIARRRVNLCIKQDRKLNVAADCRDYRLTYLYRLDDYVNRVKECIRDCVDGKYEMHAPSLKPILKKIDEEKGIAEYRPLSIYDNLMDKVIIAFTTYYFTEHLDRLLHNNILSYRRARNFMGMRHKVTDFNDGVNMMKIFRLEHSGDIFVSDCDIQKFFDTINHDVVMESFSRLTEGIENAMVRSEFAAVLAAYMRPYSFSSCVIDKSREEGFWKHSLGAKYDDQMSYQINWVGEDKFIKCYGSKEAFELNKCKIGVPQGGALSLVIANVVLNDVDRAILGVKDPHRMFCRYCDDMILMNTRRENCARDIYAYTESLTAHKLFFHPFTSVSDYKYCPDNCRNNFCLALKAGFWNIKSHDVYRLGPGGGDSSLWTGFLGYEMNFIGATRLRSSNYHKLLDRINSCASRVKRAIGKLLTVKDEKRDAQAEIVMKGIKALYDCPKRISRYKELDMPRFVHTRQYRFIVEIVNRRLLRIKEKWVDKHKDNVPECVVTCLDSFIADLTAEKAKNG